MYSHREMINSPLLEHILFAAESYTREFKEEKKPCYTSTQGTHTPLRHFYFSQNRCDFSSCVYLSLSASSETLSSVLKRGEKKKPYVYFLKVETSYTFFFPSPFQWDLHDTFPFGFLLRFLLHFKTLTTDSGSRTFLGGDGWNVAEVWKSWLFVWARGIINCSSLAELLHVTGFPVSSGGQGDEVCHSRRHLCLELESRLQKGGF